MSFDRLMEKIEALQNPTVAGLDPKLSYIPQGSARRPTPNTERRWKARRKRCCSSIKG